MNVTVCIPDIVAEEFRAGRLTGDELRDALGLGALNEIDGLLKADGIYEPYNVEDLDREARTLERLGL